MRISRRFFIGSGIASLIGVIYRPAYALLSGSGDRSSLVSTNIERLLEILSLKDSAARVGRRYLDSAPAEADLLLLYEKLATCSDDVHKALNDVADKPLRQALSAQFRDDYANGRIVTLDGWILSVTEVRICALAVLTST